MDRHTNFAPLFAAALLGCAHLCAAAPALPASSSIAAKIDFAKARALPASSAAIDCLFAKVSELGRIEKLLAQNFGIDAKKDLSTVEAWADGFGYAGDAISLENASSLARGSFSTDKLATTARAAKGFDHALVGKTEIMTADFARGYWFAFPAGGGVLVSSSQKALARSVDALSKGAKQAAASIFLQKALAADCPAVVAIDGSRGLQNLSFLTGGLVRADAQTIVAKLTEDTPGTAVIDVQMTFSDETLAAQTLATLNGVKMLSAFKQASGKSTPAALQRFIESDLTCEGSSLRMRMSVTKADLAELLK